MTRRLVQVATTEIATERSDLGRFSRLPFCPLLCLQLTCHNPTSGKSILKWLSAYSKAVAHADKQVPKPPGTTDGNLISRNSEAFEKEYDRLIAPTLKRYGIEDWQTEAIVVEDARSEWAKK